MKIKKVIVLISAFILFIILVNFIYLETNKWIYANRVTHYLIAEKKYNKDDIQSVTGVWGFKAPAFYAVVVFQDEPDIEYVYFAHAEVIQFSVQRPEKHVGDPMIHTSELKHYVPHE
ncbi:DUF3139 domain-containing protein [Paenibacillus sp. UMB4589-SE434]|uniref:DUF3139 domain-containing protein n=1 Tax=Paenibacillus sp. UMB4589-SE434 TaxID=3046314 RepID=UPI00254AE228|nr:DUF3139 domain-containing protein [Paenibacillus sp. UMB4589-SE434]MDK8182323.1 DUF3139 domain-containing protein [Paenibacillus sp. UMB4589-SE434]